MVTLVTVVTHGYSRQAVSAEGRNFEFHLQKARTVAAEVRGQLCVDTVTRVEGDLLRVPNANGIDEA